MGRALNAVTGVLLRRTQTQRDSERSPGDGRQGLEGGSYKPRTSEVSSDHQKLEGEGRTLS